MFTDKEVAAVRSNRSKHKSKHSKTFRMQNMLQVKLGANRQTLFFKHRDVSCLKSMFDGLRGQKSHLFNKKMFETMFEQVHIFSNK